MLKVKLLCDGAKAPTVAHPGEDLGFDLYVPGDTLLQPGLNRVGLGIAVEFTTRGMGAIFRDRSSMAGKGFAVTGGVLDWGYRGELMLLIYNFGVCEATVKAGERIAQMLPMVALTHQEVLVVPELGQSTRGTGGFGSSGT